MIAKILAVTLFSATLLAQTTTPQTPPSGSQGQTGAGAAAAQGPRRQRMQQMHQQHMQQMQQQLDSFAKLLEQLKADTAKIEDAAGKQVAQDNVNLWQALYEHMQGMAQMMQQGGGMMMGPGGMRPHRIGAPPATTQPKPTPPPQ